MMNWAEALEVDLATGEVEVRPIWTRNGERYELRGTRTHFVYGVMVSRLAASQAARKYNQFNLTPNKFQV